MRGLFFILLGFLFFTSNLNRAFASNQLTLHFINPPRALQWETPQKITLSTFLNAMIDRVQGVNIPIGHVIEELECGDYHRYLGMSPDGDSEEIGAILGGYGLGTMLKKYKGHLDRSESAIRMIQSAAQYGRSNFVRFYISGSSCQRLRQYIDEYEKRGLDKIYSGLDSYPLYQEGSGCSAFGASFLEVAGLLTPEMQETWMRHVVVPEEYIGGPQGKKSVNILKLIFAFGSQWESNPSRGVKIDFYDPELMNAWVTKLTKDSVGKWKVEVREGVQGVSFDVASLPPREGDFFKVRSTQ